MAVESNRQTLAFVARVALAFAFPLSGAAAAPDPVAEASEAWFAEKAAYYEAHPELKTQRGTGWKPYNRAKWFYEQRMVNGEPVPVGARYRAWEERNQIEASLPPMPRATWFALGPANLAGRILAVEFDPNDANVVYTGTAGGGLWKSTDAGVTWLSMSDETASLAVGGVAVLPSDSNVVLIGTGEGTPNIDRISGVGVLKSTDGGATWNATDLDYARANGHGFHFLKASPSTGTLLGGATDGLWRSTDAGDTWLQIESGASFYDAVWKPGDPSRVYVIRGGANNANNGVKLSTDDGATFALVGVGQPTSNLIGKSKLAVSENQPSWIYLSVSHRSNDSLLGVYRTTNDGANWTLQANSPDFYNGQGWYNVSLTADPNDANRVIAGGVELFRSTNAGVTFTEIGGNVHVDHHAANYQPGSPNDVFVGSDGGIWESTNDGSQWNDRNTGLITYQFYDICVAQSTTTFIMGGTQDQGTDRWTGTTTWGQGLGADGMVCNINPSQGNIVYAEIQSGDHRKSTNSGINFSPINNGITGNGSWVTPVAEDQTAGNGNHLFTASSAGIFRTTNGGTQWVNVRTGNAVWIDMSPVNGNYVWTVQGANAARFSTDDGTTWGTASAYGFPTSGATKVLADPIELNTVFVTFGGYSAGFAHVLRSTDLGTTWANVTGNLPSAPVNAIAVDPDDNGRWFVGTDIGVWECTDGGTTWVPFDSGFPNTVVADLEIQRSGRKLIAGTHGRGAWEVDITVGGGTGVDVATPASLNLMLDPPAPNPTSRETTLRFAAKHMGEVTLQVFDVTGRQVSELVRAPVGDGIIRMVPWLTDDVPSGVYFAVLKAGSEQLSRKIVVTR